MRVSKLQDEIRHELERLEEIDDEMLEPFDNEQRNQFLKDVAMARNFLRGTLDRYFDW